MPVPIFVLSYVLPNPGIKIFSKLLGFVSVNRTFNCTLKLRNKLLIISVLPQTITQSKMMLSH